MLRDNRGQWAIIEIVAVVAIIAVLAYFLVHRYLGSGSNGASSGGPAAPIERAHGVECQSYLSQIRSAVSMYQQSNEHPPQTLAELKSYGVSESISACPASGQPYSYDPAQGRAWCTTPGHERY